VVVVDDGSTDGTADWLASRKTPFALQIHRQANSGPANARNRGVQAARARTVVFIDDDVVPRPALLEEHLKSHAAEPDVAVIGPLLSLPHYPQPWVAWEQVQVERQYQAMREGKWRPTFRQFWTGNASVAREHVLGAGGFNPDFLRAEDIELATRLEQRRGVRFRFNPEAAGDHHAERSLHSWSRMHEAYGRLEKTIFSRLGEENALDLLAGNWSTLHPLTRALVRACLESPLRKRATAAALRQAIRAGALLPTASVAHRACSALANLLYWTSAAEADVRAVLDRALLRR
jgi:GT2 family glycosyltransferase